MPVEIIIEEERWRALDLDQLSHGAFKALMSELNVSDTVYNVTVLGCDDARIQTLNVDFRGKAQPTNVLSWPSVDRAADAPGMIPNLPDHEKDTELGDIELGDIAISFQTTTREACAQGKKARAHATHLLLHGMLHLLGYDHIEDADAAVMEAIEIKILGKMGISNPY